MMLTMTTNMVVFTKYIFVKEKNYYQNYKKTVRQCSFNKAYSQCFKLNNIGRSGCGGFSDNRIWL